MERTTNYTMLIHLPHGYTPELMRDALAEKIKTLPEALRSTLTWDQGTEMNDWKRVSIDADVEIYFADPHTPWQCGINENTNGLLRQYFPKGTDFTAHSADDLDWVTAEPLLGHDLQWTGPQRRKCCRTPCRGRAVNPLLVPLVAVQGRHGATFPQVRCRMISELSTEAYVAVLLIDANDVLARLRRLLVA